MNNACPSITSPSSLFVIAAMLLLNGQRKRKIIASASALHRPHNALSIAIAEKFHQDLTIEQICARGFPSAIFRGCFEQT
jgi:hypothetical protein